MESYIKSKDFTKNLIYFCNSHLKIYIYGAGEYGKFCYQFLQKRKIQVEGFITTEGGNDVLGLPVYKAKKILKDLSSKSGIILAVKSEYQEEIKKQFSFPCDVIEISKKSIMYIKDFLYMQNHFDLLQKKYLPEEKGSDAQWKNILVVQLEITFGDMIWSTAFCRELRRNFPNSRMIMVMNRKFTDLYKNCPYFDQIVPYECDTLSQAVSFDMMDKVDQFVKECLGDIKFDVVFLPRLFPFSYRDAWENVLLALASGAKNRIAHAMKITDRQKDIYIMASRLFTVLVGHTKAKHEVLQDLDLLISCGYQYKNDNMELWMDENDRAYASSVLREISDDTMLIAVAMVGSTKAKSWSPQKYGNVFDRISRKFGHDSKVKFVLCGGKDASEAVSKLSESQKANCIDVTGQTSLTEAAAVISRCVLYLGSDTGLKHMATSFGIPVIEISPCNMQAPDFSGAAPVRVGPWKVDSVILRPDKGLDECRDEDSCIKPYAHCINQITEEQVAEAIEAMIIKQRSLFKMME